jgi:succinoglycan biosynthesis transport protein ExoP
MSLNARFVENQRSRQTDLDETIDLAELFDVVRRRKKLLATICLTVLVAAVLLYFVTPKKYRATTTLQIERQDAGSIAIEDILRLEGGNRDYYETQYNLLRSRGLAEAVVQNLNLGTNTLFNPTRAAWLPWRNRQRTEGDDAVILGELADRLLEDLEVTPVRNTYLVKISYTAPTAELSATVANGVADAFIDWGVKKRYRTVGRASTFLSTQIEALKKEIDDKEKQLQAYGRSSDIVSLDPESNITIQSLEALNRDYTAAVSTRTDKEARYRELMRATPEAIADTLSGGLIAELRSDQAQLEREYADKLATYKAEWPAMQKLKARINEGRQNLDNVIAETVDKARETARTEYQTALRREQSLAAELARKKEEALNLNSAAVEYNNLRVEVSTRRSLLDELLRRQSETMVASRLESTGNSNVAVIDRALPPLETYRPSLLLNLALGLTLGLGLGIASVFLIEYLDRTIKSPEEADRILGLPLLGTIPDVTDRSLQYGYGYGDNPTAQRKTGGQDNVAIELLPQHHSHHGVSEAYRSLRTALLLSRADGLKTVVFSSPGPNEGKSVTVSNLAIVTAKLGRKVLVVDGDLRKPRQHRIFKVPSRKGLVGYLTGMTDLDSTILRTTIANLFVVPAGPQPPNPSELVSSQRMEAFLKIIGAKDFDLILIDSPPVLPVTDATMLGALSDGLVLCLRAGVVERADAVACKERLVLADVKVLGIVLNALKAGHRSRWTYQPYDTQLSSVRGRSGGSAA